MAISLFHICHDSLSFESFPQLQLQFSSATILFSSTSPSRQSIFRISCWTARRSSQQPSCLYPQFPCSCKRKAYQWSSSSQQPNLEDQSCSPLRWIGWITSNHGLSPNSQANQSKHKTVLTSSWAQQTPSHNTHSYGTVPEYSKATIPTRYSSSYYPNHLM